MASSSRASCDFSRRSLAVLVGGALLASAPASAAQARAAAPDASEAATAPIDPALRANFAEARRLYQDGKLVEALTLFRGLAQATRSPNAQLYVGYCLSDLGKDVDAYRAFTTTLRYAADRPETKYESARQAAENELARLNVRLSKIVINVAQPPAGLTVTLDGVPVEHDDLGSSLPVQAGSHSVGAAAAGMKPVRVALDLDPGELRTLTLALQADEKAARPVPPPRVVHRASHAQTAGYVVGGVGIVGVGVFAVAGLMTKSVHDQLQSECGAAGCSDAGHQSEIARGKSLQTVANVGLAVGVAGLLTGGVLVLLGRQKREGSRVDVSWSAGGGEVSYRGAF
jgi:hypothetical protein